MIDDLYLIVLEEVIPLRPVTIHAAAQIIFDPDQTNFLADVATVQEIRARRDRPRRNDTAISLTSFEHIFVLRRDVIILTLIGISTGVYNKQQGEKTNPGETGCDEKEPVLS